MASRSLGTLTLDLVAKIGGFVGALDKAARESEKRMKRIEDSAKKVGTAIGAVGAGAAIGLTVLVKDAIDAADELSLLSQKTGISADALSELQFAAKQSGVEDLTGALVKFNKAVSEAGSGGKEQAEAFKALGVNVRNANGELKPTEQLFSQVSESLSKFQDGANKTAVAMKLFGKSGADLIPLLNEGEDGIRKFREQAHALGLTISQETADAANNFNDSIDTLKASVTGIGRQLATDLTPKLKEFADFMSDPNTIANLAKFGEAIASSVVAAVEAVNALTFSTSRFFDFITSASPTELVDVLDEIDRVSKELEKRKDPGLFSGFNQSAESLDELNKELDELIQKRDKLFDQQRKALQSPSTPSKPEDKPDINLPDTAALEAAERERERLAKAALKAIEDAEKDSLRDRLEAEEALDAQVAQARQDLADKTGTIAEAESRAIEKKYGDLIADLKAADREIDIPVVVELMGVEQAQSEFARLQAQMEKLKEEHDRRQKEIEQSVELGSRSPLDGIDAAQQENERFAQQTQDNLGQMAALDGLSPDQMEAIAEGYQNLEDQKTEIARAGEEARAVIRDQYLAAGSQALGDAAQAAAAFGKKGFKAYKAFAIAQTIIDTYASATAAFKSLAGVPVVGPALGTAAAAAAVAVGLGRVAQIRASEPTGYMEGGFTGHGPINQVAGVVHGKEGVVSNNALRAAAEAMNDPKFWGNNASPQINITNEPGVVTVRQDDGSLLNRLAPAILQMVDVDQAGKATTGRGLHAQALGNKFGLQGRQVR